MSKRGTRIILAGVLMVTAACTTKNTGAQEEAVTAQEDFVSALLGPQPAGDAWKVPKPASSKYKPGTIFLLVPHEGGERRQLRGTIWGECAKDTTMADWVQVEAVASYAGKTGFDKSGLNLAASVPGFAASAELTKSRYTKIEATKVFEVELIGARVTERMREDPAFRACLTNLTDDSRAYLVQQGLALGAAKFSFFNDADAKIEVPKVEVAKVAEAGGGLTIDYDDNGAFTFETKDPEKNPDKLIMAAFRDVIKADGELVLAGGGLEDHVSLLATVPEMETDE